MRISIDEFDLTEIKDGKYYFRIGIPAANNNVEVSLPCFVFKRGQDPIISICAGMHGSEWNGIYSAYLLAKTLFSDETLEVNGTLVILPVMNPLAFAEMARVSTIDRLNMNRIFNSSNPFDLPATMIASQVYNQIFSKSRYVVDMHSGGDCFLLTHIRVISMRDENLFPYFNIKYVQILGDLPDGLLCKRLENDSISNINLEIGNAREIDEKLVAEVVFGLKNFLKAIGFLEGIPVKNTYQIINNYIRVICPSHGFFFPTRKIGEYIKEGDIIGRLFFTESLKEIHVPCPHAGIVFYLRRDHPTPRGEEVFQVAFQDANPPKMYFDECHNYHLELLK